MMISKVIDLNVNEHIEDVASNSKGIDVRKTPIKLLNTNYDVINAYYQMILNSFHIVNSNRMYYGGNSSNEVLSTTRSSSVSLCVYVLLVMQSNEIGCIQYTC